MTHENAPTENYYATKSTYTKLEKAGTWQGVQSLLFEPVELSEKSQIAVIVMHSDGDHLAPGAASELAKRGYRALGAAVSDRDNPLDEKLLDVKVCNDYLRQIPGVKKVITLGHSGGATLMSAYQNAAENGVQVLQGPEKLIKCSDLGKLTPADGVMLLDSNYGNGVMTLLSLDPSVKREDSGRDLDSALDLFDPANGFDPKGSTYTPEFIRKYQKAQGERNNRLIDAALERLHALENRKGKFADDEPFIVPGGAQNSYNNKLFPQDVRLLSRTRKAWPLLHADGSVTNQIIPCVRRPKNDRSFTASYRMGAIKSTVRTFLNSSAVRTSADFGYNEDSIYGIDWLSSYNCTPGNMMGVSAPTLLMGMTGGYEFLAAEIIHENTPKITDKTIAFVEGATHNFDPARDCESFPGQFGDTIKTMFDYVDDWLSQPGRFME
jgi:hypothetical protein